MPELPEVEVVRAGLERHVLGARVARVDVLHPRPVRREVGGPVGFEAELRRGLLEVGERAEDQGGFGGQGGLNAQGAAEHAAHSAHES